MSDFHVPHETGGGPPEVNIHGAPAPRRSILTGRLSRIPGRSIEDALEDAALPELAEILNRWTPGYAEEVLFTTIEGLRGPFLTDHAIMEAVYIEGCPGCPECKGV